MEPGIVHAAAAALGGVGVSEVVGCAVDAAYQAGLLQQAVVFRVRNPGRVPPALVKTVRFQPFKLLSWLPARYYYSMRRDTLDRVAARYIRRRGAALVHGWTNECRQTLKAARQTGAVAVLERNFCHPLQSREITAAEYASRGVSWPPPPHPWLRAWDHWTREQTWALEEFDLADYILVPSQFAYDTFLTRGYPPEKLVLIPRGVDVERFQPDSPPPGVFRVLFVGLLGFRKGVPYLLEAWERLGLKDAELILVGSVHEEIRPVLKKYEHLSDVRILGFHPDPAALFAQSAVFCFPSLNEGSAKVTYEALAAGLPLITTPEAGSVARDGQEGVIIPARQIEPLMAALERLYRNPEEVREMSRQARQRALDFTWEHYRQRLAAFYRRVGKWTNSVFPLESH
ncbi:MAG: glycosyltransferase [Deltaproteobacteria bacterium]|nr:glycosyltransferase [Deltaproteobacteria bacterium]